MKITGYGSREAFVWSLPTLVLMAVLVQCGQYWVALALSPLLWFVLNFFRDPERLIPSDPGLLVSPADGQVTDIDDCEVPYVGPARRISVFMNVFSVHVNRMPLSGTVEYVEHVPGKFLNAMKGEAATANERHLVGLKGDDGRKYLVVQIAGLIARNIVTPVKVGDKFVRGQRFGMIKFGSRTDVCVERDSPWTFTALKGQWVRGGSDVLGRLQG
ncbi:MAG: phosphatidylserine decarboxylase [Planctomycetota bacterium]